MRMVLSRLGQFCEWKGWDEPTRDGEFNDSRIIARLRFLSVLAPQPQGALRKDEVTTNEARVQKLLRRLFQSREKWVWDYLAQLLLTFVVWVADKSNNNKIVFWVFYMTKLTSFGAIYHDWKAPGWRLIVGSLELAKWLENYSLSSGSLKTERRQVRFLAKAVKFYGIWNKFHILKCSRRFLLTTVFNINHRGKFPLIRAVVQFSRLIPSESQMKSQTLGQTIDSI